MNRLQAKPLRVDFIPVIVVRQKRVDFPQMEGRVIPTRGQNVLVEEHEESEGRPYRITLINV